MQQHQGDEEEFVLLDLNSVSGQLDIPSNAPYVLSVCSRRETTLFENLYVGCVRTRDYGVWIGYSNLPSVVLNGI